MSKDELNTIIKFGAADLFKDQDNADDAGDEEKEVDLDAILAKAETREEEEAPISEANKELLSAFKCTNLRFQEEEPEVEKEKEEQQSTGNFWQELIPEDLREKYKPREETEDLILNDAEKNERRKRNKIMNLEGFAEVGGDGRRNDRDFVYSSDESESSSEEEVTEVYLPEDPKLRTMIQSQLELQSHPVDSFKCNQEGCEKTFRDKNHFKSHLRFKHILTAEISDDILENGDVFINLPEVKSEAGLCHFCSHKSPLLPLDYRVHINMAHGGQEPEVNHDESLVRGLARYRAIANVKNSGVKTAKQNVSRKNIICNDCFKTFEQPNNLKLHMKNSHHYVEFSLAESNFISLPTTKSTYLRCFPCSISYNTSLQYKLHIMGPRHKSVEPEINYDQETVAQYDEMMKMMICLSCQQRFATPHQLKGHMNDVHKIEVNIYTLHIIFY